MVEDINSDNELRNVDIYRVGNNDVMLVDSNELTC